MSHRRETTMQQVLSRLPWMADLTDASEGPYVVLGDLGLFLVDELRRDTGCSTRIDACFELLNALGESDDPEVLNQLQIGTLAPLTDDARAVDGARARLSGRALASFESYVREYASIGEG